MRKAMAFLSGYYRVCTLKTIGTSIAGPAADNLDIAYRTI